MKVEPLPRLLFSIIIIIKVKRTHSPRREVQKALQLRLHRGKRVHWLRVGLLRLLLILRRTLLFLLGLLGQVLLLFLLELLVAKVSLHHLVLLMSRKRQLAELTNDRRTLKQVLVGEEALNWGVVFGAGVALRLHFEQRVADVLVDGEHLSRALLEALVLLGSAHWVLEDRFLEGPMLLQRFVLVATLCEDVGSEGVDAGHQLLNQEAWVLFLLLLDIPIRNVLKPDSVLLMANHRLVLEKLLDVLEGSESGL